MNYKNTYQVETGQIEVNVSTLPGQIKVDCPQTQQEFFIDTADIVNSFDNVINEIFNFYNAMPGERLDSFMQMRGFTEEQN